MPFFKINAELLKLALGTTRPSVTRDDKSNNRTNGRTPTNGIFVSKGTISVTKTYDSNTKYSIDKAFVDGTGITLINMNTLTIKTSSMIEK